MNSTIIVRALLLARPQLIAMLGANAAAKIIIGVIPSGTPLPTIGITEVSALDHVPLAGGAVARVTARTQITVAAATVKQCKEVLSQARFACRNFVGTINGTPKITCHLEGSGPDFEHEAGFAMQTQDVRVTFNDGP